MVQINFALREVNCKIVYYGPGLSGKTTNIEVVHLKAPKSNKGELTSIATEGDRTLFFDYMPLDLGNIAGMRTKFQLYTVPGQVYYNSTRKLVLQGVDGIIFVADSQADKMEENIESLDNLRANLAEAGKDLDQIQMLIQYNKRDMPNALPVETLNELLNPRGLRTFEAVANTGEGVFPTLKALSSLVLESLSKQRSSASSRPVAQKAVAAVGAEAAPAALSAQAPAATQSAPPPAAPTAPPPTALPPRPESLPVQQPAARVAPAHPVSAPPSRGAPVERGTDAAAESIPNDGPQPVLMPAEAGDNGSPKKKKRKRKVPKAGPVLRNPHAQVKIQQNTLSNNRGKVIALVALGVIVIGALGFILSSFGVV